MVPPSGPRNSQHTHMMRCLAAGIPNPIAPFTQNFEQLSKKQIRSKSRSKVIIVKFPLSIWGGEKLRNKESFWDVQLLITLTLRGPAGLNIVIPHNHRNP